MGDILSGFFAKLVEWVQYALDYAVGIVEGVGLALVSIVKNIVYSVFSWLFDGLDAILAGTGMQGYLAVLGANYSGPLGYFLDLFQVPQALLALGGAYLIRFFIRRLPVIG